MDVSDIRCVPWKERKIPKRVSRFQGNFLLCLGRRSRDVVLAAVALLVLWPFFIIISVAIVADSPGAGPIFSQTRVGKDGKCFTMYKFRTMIPNAEAQLEELLAGNEMDGPAFKIRRDPRITRLGYFLRRSSIDELPQLWNVLRGEMSLVGPRPALPREVAMYDDRTRLRLKVRPGITGLWQISPARNRVPFEQRLKLDLQYIREGDFGMDWKILLATFGTVLQMQGE